MSKKAVNPPLVKQNKIKYVMKEVIETVIAIATNMKEENRCVSRFIGDFLFLLIIDFVALIPIYLVKVIVAPTW